MYDSSLDSMTDRAPMTAHGCRLMYVVGELRAGGLERQLHLLLEHLDRARYRPAVVVWNLRADDPYAGPIRSMGVPLTSFPEGTSSAEKLRRLRQLVVETRPEVVHSYSFYTNIAAWLAARGTNSVSIGAVQSDLIRDKRESGPWLGRASAMWPRHQIFNSFRAAENATRSGSPFVARHVHVVRNGIDLRSFSSTPVTDAGEAKIIGIGSLFHVKRWDRLLRAAASLKERGLSYSLLIVGDGPLKSALEQQAVDLGVADRVSFAGYSSDVRRLLMESTFLAHTSDTEGTSNVWLEAMACSRAVVATGAGDAAAVVEDGRTGYVVPCSDEKALVDRMATLIMDRALCRRMGDAGRSKAEREFGVDRLVSETLSVYHAAGWKGD